MDTRLKKGKKIRSFVYRMIAAGALIATIGTGILGREALVNMYREGVGTLSGDLYYLTEFREYAAYLYHQGMLGYAGIGDDNGYPLTDEKATLLAEQAREEFSKEASLTGNNLLYYIEYNGKVADSNISFPLFSEYDGHLLLPEDAVLCCYWDGRTGTLQFFSDTYNAGNGSVPKQYHTPQYKPNTEKTGNIRLLLVLKQDITYSAAYSSHLNLLETQAQRYSNTLKAFLICGAVTVISWFMCLFTRKAGKQAKADYLKLISGVWLELRILITAGIVFLCSTYHIWDFDTNVNHRLAVSAYWGLYFPIGILVYLIYIDLNGQGFAVLKQTLVYRIFCLIKQYQASMPWLRKARNMYLLTLTGSILLLAAGIKLAFTTRYLSPFIRFGGLPLGILLFLVSLRLRRFIDDTAAMADKLALITAGKNSLPLILPKSSLLASSAQDLNAVGNGIKMAVEQNNRSNKMRVELITNVSHDLKTPLTSIINYADLLCEEELPPQAAAYAQSLRDKSYRLKSMVQDVFDLSKATSGNLNIEKTKLDLVKLVRQTLADMDERITQSSLTFKLNIALEPLIIEADGEKLYRVFQNLIINALQYSLEHSRVYILLEARGDMAYARMKNISRQELNFTAEEILERFVRADTSRTTEGSGLGLSIVRSFTEACGGTFTIEMDADLFTACISFPLVPSDTQNNTVSEDTCISTKNVV